uniref:Transposase n=1 Tax=Acrobeloides nanus TaxID=290746 RepID=A0A914CGB4_9BILA
MIPLVFVDPGAKVNRVYYREQILSDVVEPWAQRHFAGRDWIFQQDSAPAHKAIETQNWIRDHFPDFISKEEWPANSPDLNPIDFSIRGILKAKACATSHKSLESLKAAILKAWNEIPLGTQRATVDEVPKRLNAYIKAKEGYFEL